MLRTSDRLELKNGFHLTVIDKPDRDAIVEHMVDKEISANTLTMPYPYTLDDADWWIDQVMRWEEENGIQKDWAIREPQGKMIGAIGLLYEFGIESHRSSIGYWLGKSYWNRGLMTEAIQALCDHILATRPIVRLEAAVFQWNKASARCLQKAGFEHEGLLRKAYLKNGEAIDAHLWSIVE